MGDKPQKSPDGLVRRGVGRGAQCRPERGGIVAIRAPREIIAKDVRHPSAVDPPILGANERRADRNAGLGFEQQVEREIHRPRGEVLALHHHPVDAGRAIAALGERCTGRARQRPAIAFDVLQDDGERYRRSGQKIDRLDELRVYAERARMRGA